MGTYACWVAAVEQLPPDHRGFRRVLRLHAVEVQDDGLAVRAACGYRHGEDELRPDRAWETVTPSGRCALCAQQLAGVAPPRTVDLVARDRRGEAFAGEDRRVASRRLHVVPDSSSPWSRGAAGRR
jgi:hypothetical protein